MRIILLAISIFFALSGLAKAGTSGPIFGGQATGSFEVADQAVDMPESHKVVVHAANDCASPDCAVPAKTAQLAASGGKP